ncbi:type II secretion system F family protein [Actinomadura rupiterrae]|uniref:type II secretion system F family protein n=1 Tax=Actinomadura rupiterrae TaxID=559627 RepID=UPI0020A3568C|nr:type II secretion system F family protein [Actinomadura rupiterrae]MCP2338910.1 Flp pilus assembly protein TadB [Actinomadura rupiterrae]
MDAVTALAALLGVGAGLGLLAIWGGLRRRPRTLRLRPGRGLLPRRSPLRLVAVVGAGVVAAAFTRWPVAALLAAAAGWWLPELLGPDRAYAAAVARIEAIASWTESLRDTLASAAGLEQTIIATAQVAPVPIAVPVAELAACLEGGARLPDALADFADTLGDATADLVVTALTLAVRAETGELGPLLGRLAVATRDQAQMRLRIAAGRARTRSSVRIIIGATLAMTAGLLVWSRSFLAPYTTPLGQIALLAIGACFATAFAWLHRMSHMPAPPRLLTPRART